MEQTKVTAWTGAEDEREPNEREKKKTLRQFKKEKFLGFFC